MEQRTDTNKKRTLALAGLRSELARRIATHAANIGEQGTPISGLTLYRLAAQTPCYPAAYDSGIAVFAQGRKRVTVGRTVYHCDESSFLLTSANVPLVSEIVEASEGVPLLALFLKLDLEFARELLKVEELREYSSPVLAGYLGRTTPGLLQACIRLVDLLDSPEDIPFLASLIHREVIYRILQSPQGSRLRAMASLDAHSRGTAKAVTWLRRNYMKPFSVEQLASVAGMGSSTLHHHFRAMTSMSPLQFQKQLRLFAARERMLTEGLDATRAAFEVGYESASQFTREYKRLFGQPPMKDVKARRLGSGSSYRARRRNALTKDSV